MSETRPYDVPHDVARCELTVCPECSAIAVPIPADPSKPLPGLATGHAERIADLEARLTLLESKIAQTTGFAQGVAAEANRRLAGLEDDVIKLSVVALAKAKPPKRKLAPKPAKRRAGKGAGK